MSTLDESAEKSKLEPQGPTSVDGIAGNVNAPRESGSPPVDRLPTEKKPVAQSSGRPPHAPYSRQQGYPGQHSGYPGATRPAQQLQSVVTNSFSAEDERDPSHRGAYPPVPRHVNVSINPADQQRWAGSTEDRYPPERLEVDVRDMEQERRQEPPGDGQSLSGKPSVVPPSPARGSFPPLRRGGSGSGGGSFMAPPEPLKRSFWHHSRPNEEYTSSLPPEFIPPKRTKLSPAQTRCDPSSRSTSGMEMRDLRRPPSFFNRSLSWDSRGDEMPYYHGMPPSRESPRYSSDNRSFYPSMGGQPHHHHHHQPSPSPPVSYRDDDMGSMSDHSRSSRLPPPGRSHHHQSYSHMPPQEVSYHHHNSPSHGSAVGAPIGHHSRRWSHHDSWQAPMPSPSSGPRRSPTNYHHGSPTMQFRDDVESNRGWSQSRERDPMPMSREEHRRLPHFDAHLDHESAYHSGHAYHPSPYYGRSMPPLHHKPPPHHSPMHSSRGAMPLDAPGHRSPVVSDGRGPTMDDNSHMGSDAGKGPEESTNGKNGEKEGPLLLLALPQDRISLSETLCVVREVSTTSHFQLSIALVNLKSHPIFVAL